METSFDKFNTKFKELQSKVSLDEDYQLPLLCIHSMNISNELLCCGCEEHEIDEENELPSKWKNLQEGIASFKYYIPKKDPKQRALFKIIVNKNSLLYEVNVVKESQPDQIFSQKLELGKYRNDNFASKELFDKYYTFLRSTFPDSYSSGLNLNKRVLEINSTGMNERPRNTPSFPNFNPNFGGVGGRDLHPYGGFDFPNRGGLGIISPFGEGNLVGPDSSIFRQGDPHYNPEFPDLFNPLGPGSGRGFGGGRIFGDPPNSNPFNPHRFPENG